MGKITYLGYSSFLVEYQDQRLIIDPYLKWLHTGKLTKKNDPLSFGLADTLKHKLSAVSGKNLIKLIDPVDFILISSNSYNYFDHIKDFHEANQQLLLIGSKAFIVRWRNCSIGQRLGDSLDYMTIAQGENIRFTFFEVKAVPTNKERTLKRIIKDSEDHSMSYSIHADSLQLYFSNVGEGQPRADLPMNVAILPMNLSRYSERDFLEEFYKRFKPEIIIPYFYDQKSYSELKDFEKNRKKRLELFFPKIGESLAWN